MKLIQVFICHVSFVSVSKFVFACPAQFDRCQQFGDISEEATKIYTKRKFPVFLNCKWARSGRQRKGRWPKFAQKENFSTIISGLDQEGKGRGGDQNSHTKKVLLNYKWPGSGRKGCSSTHVDVGLIFVWKQAGTPRAKVNLVNV